jgi:hypothetical protein
VRKVDRDGTRFAPSHIRSQRCLWEICAGAQQSKAKLEWRDCTRFTPAIQRRDVNIKVEFPWTITAIKHKVPAPPP